MSMVERMDLAEKEARARLEAAHRALQARLRGPERPQTPTTATSWLTMAKSWLRVWWEVSDAQEALDRALARQGPTR